MEWGNGWGGMREWVGWNEGMDGVEWGEWMGWNEGMDGVEWEDRWSGMGDR